MQDKVKVVLEVPLDTVISYPIAKTAASSNGEEARRFIAYVLSPAGQAVLQKFGFRKP
jgi:molybdate transport system substrate-binding protein